jgi:hypothetical protein
MLVLQAVAPAHAWVALMEGQTARPLRGRFNATPVLHSNQPEEVEGPGVLVSTLPGHAYAAETGAPIPNATYTFEGEFGLHLHHKYFPPYRGSIAPGQRRTELTLATILVNPGNRPVHIRFESGAVRNSFEAPYLARHLMGVRPLGPRPWNTGPGDATAVMMLRGQLDRRLADEITIPARGRIVLFQTRLPALGIANALLRGRSDGPFQVGVVAARNPTSDADIFAVLDSGRLAPGRVYLGRLEEIRNRAVFSRVAGVALGDAYQASLSHDLRAMGPLHVPLTSTVRTHFGTGDVQVNRLATRMADSALDNVGTYGVRFDVDLSLRGSGAYELVFSHPALDGRDPFTAFRGSLQIQTPEGLREVHVGLRSGQSLSLAQLQLLPGVAYPVRVSLVYPADATPGHLLSVVPSAQYVAVLERERLRELARRTVTPASPPKAPPPPVGGGAPAAASPVPRPPVAQPPVARPPVARPPVARSPAVPPPAPPPLRPPPLEPPLEGQGTLLERYRRAVEAQRQLLEGRRDF